MEKYLNRALQLGLIFPSKISFECIGEVLKGLQDEALKNGVVVSYDELSKKFIEGFHSPLTSK